MVVQLARNRPLTRSGRVLTEVMMMVMVMVMVMMMMILILILILKSDRAMPKGRSGGQYRKAKKGKSGKQKRQLLEVQRDGIKVQKLGD